MPDPSWRSMRDQALLFDAAARRLRSPVPDESKQQSLNVPAIVLAAFAAELALKAEIVRCGAPVKAREFRTHNLGLLLQMLCVGSRIRIETIMRSRDPGYHDVVVKAHLSNFPWAIMEAMIPKSLDDWLKHCGDAFEDWRYSFESEKLVGGISFLFAFVDAVLSLLDENAGGDNVGLRAPQLD